MDGRNDLLIGQSKIRVSASPRLLPFVAAEAGLCLTFKCQHLCRCPLDPHEVSGQPAGNDQAYLPRTVAYPEPAHPGGAGTWAYGYQKGDVVSGE
jgi:hypothetical protein